MVTTTNLSSGRPPEGFSDAATAFVVEERPDGVYVRLPVPEAAAPYGRRRPVKTLVAFGITHVFGMVRMIPIWASPRLYVWLQERGQITYIGIRHEGAASFAASAYGKLIGRPAACLAIVSSQSSSVSFVPRGRTASTTVAGTRSSGPSRPSA